MIRTSMNFEFADPKNFAYVSSKSQTVPNQVLSPAEMLDRFTRGQTVDTSFLQPYYSSIELPQIDRLDFVDRAELAEENAEKIAQMKSELDDIKTKRNRSAQKEALRREIADEDAANPKPEEPTS